MVAMITNAIRRVLGRLRRKAGAVLRDRLPRDSLDATSSATAAAPLVRPAAAPLADAASDPPEASTALASAGPPEPTLLCWPIDHHYSPVPDSRALAREPARSRVWPGPPRDVVGVDWRDDEQVTLLRDSLGRRTTLPLPSEPTGDLTEYHSGNDMFSRLDAWVLQAMLRHLRPRQLIEIGCGWSSLMTARVNREELDGQMNVTCIEPYPPAFLEGGVPGITELIATPVQDVPVSEFLRLRANDVLFIDSSHTVKTGGDVTYLVEEVLPRLARGAVIHFHDIFLPFDYPQDWVFSGRAWNEQYLVRAFLAFNSEFQVLLSVGWMAHNHPDLLADTLPNYPDDYANGGGSLWLQRR